MVTMAENDEIYSASTSGDPQNGDVNERQLIIEMWKQKEKEKRERKAAAARLKRERMKERQEKRTHSTSTRMERDEMDEVAPSKPSPPFPSFPPHVGAADFLISRLFQCSSLHVSTSSPSSYRNKVTYTLRPPLFTISSLACPEINQF
jgi:hypothetical protein